MQVVQKAIAVPTIASVGDHHAVALAAPTPERLFRRSGGLQCCAGTSSTTVLRDAKRRHADFDWRPGVNAVSTASTLPCLPWRNISAAKRLAASS